MDAIECRVREAIKAIRGGITNGPFWIADTGLFIKAGKSGVKLLHATPHYCNPLNPLSPVTRNAGYRFNAVVATAEKPDSEAFALLCEAIENWSE